MPNVIESIRPFNKFFYQSCFYNSFLAVMEYYNIHLLNIIGCIDGYYDLSENNQLKFDYLDDIVFSYNKKTIKELADKAGLAITDIGQESFLTFIINEITLARPVIAIVDCYYLPYRIDTYNKVHDYHPLLVKGYDKQNEKYNIIDQINGESLTYSDFVIGFNELEQGLNAYNAYKNMDNPSCLFSYICCNKKDVTVFELGKDVASAKKSHYQKMLQGLSAISRYIGVLSIKDSMEHMDSLIIQLNTIINQKAMELYKLDLLLVASDDERKILLQDVSDDWKIIRRDLYLYYYVKGNDDSTLYRKITGLLNKIHEHEAKYCEFFIYSE